MLKSICVISSLKTPSGLNALHIVRAA